MLKIDLFIEIFFLIIEKCMFENVFDLIEKKNPAIADGYLNKEIKEKMLTH